MKTWGTPWLAIMSIAMASGCSVEIGNGDHNINEYLDGFGACNHDSACASDAHCVVAAGTCGTTVGRCVRNTNAHHPCAAGDAPVCGCDGADYANACEAFSASVTVAHDGTCNTPPQDETPPQEPPPREEPPEEPTDSTCGGTLCSDDEFCNYEDGSCGSNSAVGTCLHPMEVCTSSTAPVCGCDGNTYEGPCDAQKAGVSIAASGPC